MLSVISVVGIVLFSLILVTVCLVAVYLIKFKISFSKLDVFEQEEFNGDIKEAAELYKKAFFRVMNK